MKIHVLRNEAAYETLFRNMGHAIVEEAEADIICFTGGSDVTPFLYGEADVCSFNSPERDVKENTIFRRHLGAKKFVGICRGAQFLNVMCGGRMWQDVDNHTRSHEAEDITGKAYRVTSTHHQMMRPAKFGEVWGVASPPLATYKKAQNLTREEWEDPINDIEVVYYPHQKVLCFQPHPEFEKPGGECFEYFRLVFDRAFGE